MGLRVQKVCQPDLPCPMCARYNAGMPTALAKALLRWYETHARPLPWRETSDPYAIWISEIMLQQTRVTVVIPYYARWMARFPTLQALAEASSTEVLRLWEGLGYYQRAHNLLRAAHQLVRQNGGRFPQTAEELRRLPGIGRYTAAAIAAIAFGADEIMLDGNLRRVLSRLFDLELDPRTPQGERRLRAEAKRILPKGRASDFNQALMDLAALTCAPVDPACTSCPLEADCLARQRGRVTERPVRSARANVPHVEVAAAVLLRGERVLIGRRPAGGLLGGLWEFPGGKIEEGEDVAACLERELDEELGIAVAVGEHVGTFRHAYTHFGVTVHAMQCRLVRGRPQARAHAEVRWVDVGGLTEFPMGKVDRAIARKIGAGLRPAPHGAGEAHPQPEAGRAVGR
jgi:A/G-specific adenine glycosylase